MSSLDVNPLALAVIGLGILLLLFFTFLSRRGFKPALRPLSGYEALTNQVGQAIESGGRVHVSLAQNGLIGEDTGTTLAGLAVLDIVAGNSAISDRSPVATTADAATVFVIGDIMRQAYVREGLGDKYEPTAVRLVALDATALAGGATSIVADDDVRANLLIGSFGPEVALIAEAGQRQQISQTIGSDRLEAQAVAYVMADHALIGEEIYTARAYLTPDAPATGSLAIQDVLRWLIIVAIGIGVIFQTLRLGP